MTQITGEGMDLPALDVLTLAAPVAPKGNIIQQIGHVTRGTTTSATIFGLLDHRVPALTTAFRKLRSDIRAQGMAQQPKLSLIDADLPPFANLPEITYGLLKQFARPSTLIHTRLKSTLGNGYVTIVERRQALRQNICAPQI